MFEMWISKSADKKTADNEVHLYSISWRFWMSSTWFWLASNHMLLRLKWSCIWRFFPRCVEGPKADFYGYRGCEDWAKKEYCVLKDKILVLLELEVCTLTLRVVHIWRRGLRLNGSMILCFWRKFRTLKKTFVYFKNDVKKELLAR